MSTVSTIKNALSAIISKANAKTGGADTTVDAAVDRLIDGYGTGGSSPSGSIDITENGTYDVTDYAQAVVDVSSAGSAENGVTRVLSIASALGGTATTINTIITGDSFVKKHYADDNFFITLIPTSPVAASTGAICGLFHGNRKLADHSNFYAGYGMFWTSETAVATYPIVTKVNGSTYQAAFRVNSSGNLVLYLPANRYLSAGTYQIVLSVAG